MLLIILKFNHHHSTGLTQIHASHVSWRRTKTSMSSIFPSNFTLSILASLSKRLQGISSIYNWSKMSYKEDCPFLSTWQLSWVLMLYNVSSCCFYCATADSLISYWKSKIFYIFLLTSIRQLSLVIMMRASTHTDVYQNFASFQIKQKSSSIAFARFISNWKTSVQHKLNLIIWIKSNGLICMVLTFIQCW